MPIFLNFGAGSLAIVQTKTEELKNELHKQSRERKREFEDIKQGIIEELKTEIQKESQERVNDVESIKQEYASTIQNISSKLDMVFQRLNSQGK